MTEKKRITVGETAFELGVSEKHIYQLIRAGRLEAINISTSGNVTPQSIRISVSSVVAFLKSRAVAPDSFFASE